jgi:hypothetical protein
MVRVKAPRPHLQPSDFGLPNDPAGLEDGHRSRGGKHGGTLFAEAGAFGIFLCEMGEGRGVLIVVAPKRCDLFGLLAFERHLLSHEDEKHSVFFACSTQKPAELVEQHVVLLHALTSQPYRPFCTLPRPTWNIANRWNLLYCATFSVLFSTANLLCDELI